jgi:hypothetical protein
LAITISNVYLAFYLAEGRDVSKSKRGTIKDRISIGRSVVLHEKYLEFDKQPTLKAKVMLDRVRKCLKS